jgi:isopentenyl-diphosphate delta-isomerase
LTRSQQVILVDEQDKAIGEMEKLEAHKSGRLHRAFSVFIFNSEGKMLLQRRALSKYHSAGLWTNACCSHPAPGEETMQSAERRLKEELGFTTSLEKAFDFIYNVKFQNGLIEHEFDHVFTGVYDGVIEMNEEEVVDFTFETIDSIWTSLSDNSEKYTEWFRIAFPKLVKSL